jgi:hypothetical protein
MLAVLIVMLMHCVVVNAETPLERKVRVALALSLSCSADQAEPAISSWINRKADHKEHSAIESEKKDIKVAETVPPVYYSQPVYRIGSLPPVFYGPPVYQYCPTGTCPLQ